MKNISKRLLALAIALVMVIGMIPVVASVASAASASTTTSNFRAHEHYTNKSHEGWTEWKGTVTPPKTTGDTNDYKFYLSDDATMGNWLDLRCGNDVTICLCGHTLTGPASQRLFRLAGGATVTIVDCTATGMGFDNDYSAGKIVASSNSDGCIVGSYTSDQSGYEPESGNFYMYDGIVSGRTTNTVPMFNMNGEAVLGIYGGKLMGNKSATGGAIKGAATTYKLVGASSSTKAGGPDIYVENAMITGCESTANGGAIYVENGNASATLKRSTLVIDNSVISGNKGHRGGAVYVLNNTDTTIKNSTITNNTTNISYAAFVVNGSNCPVTVSGTTVISGNPVTQSGFGTVGAGLQLRSTGASLILKNLNQDSNIKLWCDQEDSDEGIISVSQGTLPIGTIYYYRGTKDAAITTKGEVGQLTDGTIVFCDHEWVEDVCSKCGLEKISYVAQIGTTTYTSVADAVAAATAGQTITLLTNATTGDLNLDGITLDLNGKNLVANSVAAMNGKITDSSEDGTGLLKVAQDKITLAADNALAVWNGADGFHFTDVTWKVKALKNDNGTYKVRFIPVTSATVADLLKNGGSDNLFDVKLNVTWNGGSKTFAYGDNLVGQLYSGNNGVAETGYVFTFTFTGVESFANLKVAAYVVGGGNTADTCGYEWEV